MDAFRWFRKTHMFFFCLLKNRFFSGVLWLHGARRMGFGGTCWTKGSLGSVILVWWFFWRGLLKSGRDKQHVFNKKSAFLDIFFLVESLVPGRWRSGRFFYSHFVWSEFPSWVEGANESWRLEFLASFGSRDPSSWARQPEGWTLHKHASTWKLSKSPWDPVLDPLM